MHATSDLPLSVGELERALRAADGSAILAPPRILRRVIKHDRRITGLGLKVPHRKSYVIGAAALLEIAERDELGLGPAEVLPPTVILLARPDAEKLAAMTRGEALVKYWRLLFHARIHVEMERLLAEEGAGRSGIRERIGQIGEAAFDQVRAVLQQEDMLLPPAESMDVYIEFVAVWLELRYFAPGQLPLYFSALVDARRIDERLSAQLDVEALYRQCRPRGAPEPVRELQPPAEEPEELEADELVLAPARQSELTYRRLSRRAARALGRGNAVRAAILRARAARHVRPSLAARARAAARDDLNRLADRLRRALDLSEAQSRRWARVLGALLKRSVQGFWTRESRILYDLQKVCVDYEREIYTLDLVEWALARGRLPIKRHLPGQREVLMAKHLASAARRAAAARVSEADRGQLAALLEAAVHRAEEKLRALFRPTVRGALAAAGLEPVNLPERVAGNKLIEELLDRVVDRGFLNMADLRDAISRNGLKLPDLDGARELLLGDHLLRADRELATAMEGVYHRGETYLRWPQRLSSLAFGTRPGRVLVRYVALPFGGAYLALEGLKHLLGPLVRFAASGELVFAATESEHGGEEAAAMLAGTLVVGLILLGLMYVETFRRACMEAARKVYRTCRAIFFEAPAWVMRQPVVRQVVDSSGFKLAARYLFKPLVFTALVLTVFPALKRDLGSAVRSGLLVFLFVNLLLNSRLGRTAEEVFTDWAVRSWDHFRIRILAALFHLVMDFFNRVVDTLDRLLYSVDEWLRFRAGQGRISVIVKAGLGLVWFLISYVVRFCINLLIEPQINPVKHFPVVTVSHKIIAPLCAIYLQPALLPLGKAAATTIATTVALVLPGVFGFLVWELKENWRLYQANRPERLGPVPVGHHGETVVRLVRPGLHSGTLPKLFARLRRANRKAHWTGNWRASRKHRRSIETVREAVRRFVDREFVTLLSHSRRWQPLEMRLGRVEVGSHNVRIELINSRWPDSPIWLAWDEQSGWLVARILEPGWIEELTAEQARALADGLTGLYKMAGVSLVREQIEAVLERGRMYYDIIEEGLLAWPEAGASPPLWIDLRRTDETGGPEKEEGLTERLLFAAAPVTWALWVEVWERDQAGGRYPPRLLIGSTLLSEPRQHEPSGVS